MHFETRAIHDGQEPDSATGAITTPIYQTSTYVQDAVGVHKADGNEVGTLRISVDERASSDIELNRLETSTESAEVLAHELIMDLRSQLPPAS